MRKILPYLGASLSALALAWTAPSHAQDGPFKDVPKDHWAYADITTLQEKGILKGYPTGFFSGKKFLTRYEFAVALKRALDNLPSAKDGAPGAPGAPGANGANGEAGPKGDKGDPGMTPEEVTALQRLTAEFKNDLAGLGASVKDIGSRLDILSKQVGEITKRLDNMPHIGGSFFVGTRSDLSRNGYVDYSGAARGSNHSLFRSVGSPHDFHLNVSANLKGGVKFVGDLVSSNYLSYRASGDTLIGGGANPNGGAQQTTLHKAYIEAPIAGLGSGTVLTVGRFGQQITPLTYKRPDLDAYFDLPWYDNGDFIQDGVRLQSKYGSATTSLFLASYSGLTTGDESILNKPMVGRSGAALNPIGYNPMGAVDANQVAGVHVGLPLSKYGELGLTLLDFSTNGSGGPAPNASINDVFVYGVNLNLKEIGRLGISAEAAKSVTASGFDKSDGRSNDDNNAYTVKLGYETGPAHIHAGYRYIDPRFGAPGYWEKLGNWYNPTNIQGPFFSVGWKLSEKLHVHFGGDYYNGARNRPGEGLTMGSSVTRAKAGIGWHLSERVGLSAMYEGVYWDVNNGEGRSKPVEQFITVGANVNLSGNTVLKLAYQLIGYSNLGGVNTPIGLGIVGNNSNANVFTTQVAVHF